MPLKRLKVFALRKREETTERLSVKVSKIVDVVALGMHKGFVKALMVWLVGR